ncbi:hypothetical protein ACK3SF_03875 [Candidatus Nanosalina sp. VS9-1]|uniref:hypothetical protein n=1 Tax=Candidatus Nanosalina sp. VS9-1 TaxID=3388566 RepID=UPI0039E1CA1D
MSWSEYGAEALDYSVESADFLYDSSAAVEISSASPGGMEAAAVVALIGGSTYFGYRRSKQMWQELEEEYLED